MSTASDKNKVTEKMIDFLKEIGIRVSTGSIAEDTFLPGIEVRAGTLIIDEAKLSYPGDLLHEAGHLAVMTAEERNKAGTTIDTGGGEEMAAIAWSYAAALHLRIDPAIVFHADGYKGGSQAILENFAEGRYIGVSLLQWWGMTVDKKRAEPGIEPYPKMIKWLRN